jgi:hypothetical protein
MTSATTPLASAETSEFLDTIRLGHAGSHASSGVAPVAAADDAVEAGKEGSWQSATCSRFSSFRYACIPIEPVQMNVGYKVSAFRM